jgi:protein-disulfide isomerase
MSKPKTNPGKARKDPVPRVSDARRGRDLRTFYIALAAIAIAGIAILIYQTTRPKGSVAQLTNVTPIPNRGHVIGSDSARVEVVEFADFECPGCGSFANLTEPDVRTRLVNTGQVRFRFIDFPLPMHPNAPTAHMAAWCAGDQGRFWEMHDVIFRNQDRWSSYATKRPAGVLEGLARQVGLDMSAYGVCMESQKFAAQIRANYDEGVRLKVPSTPTFIIGSKMISEVLTYDALKRHVDEATRAVARP